MKTIANALASHLAGEVTTLATCWKLTRRDGTVMGFTDHVQNLTVDGLAYEAASGFLPGAVHSGASLAVDRLEAEGILDSAGITEADVMAGLYDFAEVQVFVVNHADISQGALRLRTGWLGEVRMENGRFHAEIRGLAQKLAQPVGELYSPLCRATLGDSRCGYNLAGATYGGTVEVSEGRTAFVDSGKTQGGGFFSFGKVTFHTGANAGLAMEVKEFRHGRFVLALPMPYAIEAGDEYLVVPGCDKTIRTCAGRFGNAVRFRGEPHVPGIDRVMETAGTRSG